MSSIAVPASAADPLDLPTLFFARIAADHRHVAEIGAAAGKRIIAIKQALPGIQAFGFDLSDAYDAEPREVAGVRFARYAPERLQALPEGTLVVCVGTLVCLDPDELERLLRLLHAKRMPLAFFEPAPVFRATRSFRRRAASGHYHNYDGCLRQAGFVSRLTARWPYLGSPELEKWTYDYAVPGT